MTKLTDLHTPPSRYLHTHCKECMAPITISAAVKVGALIQCWQCDSPARIWQLIGRANRGPLDARIGGTEAA